MILTVGNTKGGTGKSTIAVNLAVLHAKTRSVLLVDGDEQKSALSFTELREKEDYTAVALTGISIRQQVPSLSKNYQTIIIDVGGRDTGSFRAALTICDILLIPVQPRTFDVWAMEETVLLFDEAKTFNENLKGYVLLNLAEVQGKDNEEARQAILEYQELTLLDAVIMRRKVYAESISKGLGMMEMKPRNGKAVAEFEQVVAELYHRSVG